MMEASPDSCGLRSVQSLLLLYLLLVKAAAGCPKPQGRENFVLTNEALLMNDFPEGVEVTLECANGYDRESGSGTITCMDEKWTEPDLTCKKKDCGLPPPQPNMSFNISAGTLFGSVIKAVCDKGYKIKGSAYKQCYLTGWSGRAKCNIVTCAKPPEVTNGRISWDAQDLPKYGEMIQYTCDEGFTLIGEDSIVCGATGKYDSQPPECKGVTAEDRRTTASPAQEASSSADSSASTPAAASPSIRGGTNILAAVDPTTSVTTSTSSSVPGKTDEAVDSNKDVGNLAVIISVIAVSLVVSIVVFLIHKFLLKRKGSSVNGTAPIC